MAQKLPTQLLAWAGNRTCQANSLCGRKNRTIPFRIAAWNIRTLLDTFGTDRPQRRTALVTSELKRYSMDVAALSETRLLKEGSLNGRGLHILLDRVPPGRSTPGWFCN